MTSFAACVAESNVGDVTLDNAPMTIKAVNAAAGKTLVEAILSVNFGLGIKAIYHSIYIFICANN
ncbi:conserved protein of unknown function [Shewanella benthica]|uniref:Uncharacterized protein n=1 Tax=Shewanella benthica TaxID=43661 RepID=A0A330M3G4_9GAMM|nr:conserved protein of unknown function [Shewanella benthica]